MGQNRLLAIGKRYGPLTPTHYLVAVDSRLYGCINFSGPWKNEGVTTVALQRARRSTTSFVYCSPLPANSRQLQVYGEFPGVTAKIDCY